MTRDGLLAKIDEARERCSPFYFCNKCGYFGDKGPDHSSVPIYDGYDNRGCSYQAGQSFENRIVPALIGMVREVVEMHKPIRYESVGPRCHPKEHCSVCGDDFSARTLFPCPTIQAAIKMVEAMK